MLAKSVDRTDNLLGQTAPVFALAFDVDQSSQTYKHSMVVWQSHARLSFAAFGGLVVGHAHQSDASVSCKYKILAADGTESNSEASLHLSHNDLLVCKSQHTKDDNGTP